MKTAIKFLVCLILITTHSSAMEQEHQQQNHSLIKFTFSQKLVQRINCFAGNIEKLQQIVDLNKQQDQISVPRPSIIMLAGLEGSGKSNCARTFVNQLDKEDCLFDEFIAKDFIHTYITINNKTAPRQLLIDLTNKKGKKSGVSPRWIVLYIKHLEAIQQDFKEPSDERMTIQDEFFGSLRLACYACTKANTNLLCILGTTSKDVLPDDDYDECIEMPAQLERVHFKDLVETFVNNLQCESKVKKFELDPHINYDKIFDNLPSLGSSTFHQHWYLERALRQLLQDLNLAFLSKSRTEHIISHKDLEAGLQKHYKI